MSERFIFKHSYKRAPGSGQMNVFKQTNNAVLVNYRFKRSNHALYPSPFDFESKHGQTCLNRRLLVDYAVGSGPVSSGTPSWTICGLMISS